MDRREWPLVIFTLLTQMAVGLYIHAAALYFALSRNLGEQTIAASMNPVFLTVPLILVIGGIAARFHLGRPSRSVKAMANLSSSWLSREIFFGLLFGVLSSLCAAVQWFGIGPPDFRRLIMSAAILSGLALVFALSRLYMLRTVPVWNTPATPIGFCIVALLLGSTALITWLVVLRAAGAASKIPYQAYLDSIRWLWGEAVLLWILQLILKVLQTAVEKARGGVAAKSLCSARTQHGMMLVFHIALAALGVGSLGLLVFQGANSALMIVIAFTLLLASQILGRMLFYASYTRVGL